MFMSKKMASIILANGVVLAGLSIFIQQTAPAFAKVTLITAIAGGALCVVWSIVALAGHQRRTWAALTLIAVTVILLSQAVQAWVASSDATNLPGRLVLTIMLLMTMGMLLYVLHGERPPEFYVPGAARRESASSRAEGSQSPGAGRRS